jgi:hypothetical protein
MNIIYKGRSTHYYRDIRQISTKQLLKGHEVHNNISLIQGHEVHNNISLIQGHEVHNNKKSKQSL